MKFVFNMSRVLNKLSLSVKVNFISLKSNSYSVSFSALPLSQTELEINLFESLSDTAFRTVPLAPAPHLPNQWMVTTKRPSVITENVLTTGLQTIGHIVNAAGSIFGQNKEERIN